MPDPGVTIQMRVVEKHGVELTRGLTVELERDGTGNRYFYSEANSVRLGTWTTVESWSEPDGSPILAIYRSGAGDKQIAETRFEFDDRTVTITKSSRPNKPIVLQITGDQSYVLSQFNPAMFVSEGEAPRNLMIFEPISARAILHTVAFAGTEHVLLNGVKVGGLKRFEVTSDSGTTTIRTDLDGRFVMSENSQGIAMRLVPVSESDWRRALEIIRRVAAVR
jgi:hypothetical protein